MAETTARRRLHVMVDLVGYSSLIGSMQTRQRADMLSLLDAASAAAGLDAGSWYRQATGDGLLAVLPEDADAARAAVNFIRELDSALGNYNDSLGPEPRLQLRVALATAVSRTTQHGWAGVGVVTVARLADAPVVREALANSPRANMTVVIDQSLYRDLVMQPPPGFRPEDWAQVRIRAKEFDAAAYLSIPGTSIPASTPAAGSSSRDQGRDPAWARTADVSAPRWLISAPAGIDLRPLVAGLRERGVMPYVMSDVALLGETILQGLLDAILMADRVIVVLADGRQSLNSAFEAGLAAAHGRPLVVIAPPGVTMPSDLAGFLTVRARPDEMDAIRFALDQAEAWVPATAKNASAPGGALGARADDLLALANELRTRTSSAAFDQAFLSLVTAAIEGSGVVVVDGAGFDHGFDLGVWADDLGAISANPLLIQLKQSIGPQAVQRALQLVQAHPSAHAVLIVYLDRPANVSAALSAAQFPVLAISLAELLARMKGASFAEVVRQLRNQVVHGTATG